MEGVGGKARPILHSVWPHHRIHRTGEEVEEEITVNHVTPSNSNNNSSNHHHRQSAANSTGNGSHLLLYRWAPLTPSLNNGNANDKIEGDNNEESKTSKDDGVAVDEPSKHKFKYIPVALLEEQMNEASRQCEDEAKPMETDQDGAEQTSNNDSIEEKPDINYVPADGNQSFAQARSK